MKTENRTVLSRFMTGKDIVLPLMVIAASPTALGGYGDVPDVFDSTTGYVTMSGNDNTGAGNQSFFLATHWSDGKPPHSDTSYYVQSDRCFGTPHVNDDVTAQQAKDPTG